MKPTVFFRSTPVSKMLPIIASLLLSTLALPATSPVPDAARNGYEAISQRDMKYLLTFIASDELEGRNTGSRGLKIAAKFLESQYRLAGLTPAFATAIFPC